MVDKLRANRSKIGKAEESRMENSPPGIKAQNLGVGGSQSVEPIPGFIQTASERVITNYQGSWIVLGRDRPGNILSGKGGRGDTGVASIDLVVGRMSGTPVAKTPQDESVFVDPDFTRDAARIYISQKTDIDTNFDLTMGPPGPLTKDNRSGIGIKADLVRVVAREGVKIVSGVDLVNSQNARVSELSGVELIAYGQDVDGGLQPLVKGVNLLEALNSLAGEVDKLAAVVEGLLVQQTTLNEAFGDHWHQSPFFGAPTTPSPLAKSVSLRVISNHMEFAAMDIQTVRKGVLNFREKYLNDKRSNVHINSRHNKTT